jgi:PEGA domain-containing protein
VIVRASIAAWLVIAAPPVEPDPERPLTPIAEHDETRAREEWTKGAAAFEAGRLDEAIEHFEQTYRYSGRPGPLFSLGQAHRHLWEQHKDDRQRRLAIKRFQQYLDVDPEGRRKLEAEKWITLLQSESELEDLGEPAPIFTRLGISSRTPGASASIDGGAFAKLPITPDVAPGRHEVVVTAPGFREERRAVEVPEGSTLPVELTLEPVAARLTVRGPLGSELWVDGERVARLPTRGPVVLPPGPHEIGVAQRGRSLFVRELDLDRGEAERVDAKLERTGQRKIALAAVVVGSTATAASIVLMALTFDAQRRAKRVARDRSDGDGIGEAPFDHGLQIADRRDALRTAALATGVTGLTVLATGIVLWLTDRPPTSQLHRRIARVSIDAGRGFTGASLRGAF